MSSAADAQSNLVFSSDKEKKKVKIKSLSLKSNNEKN